MKRRWSDYLLVSCIILTFLVCSIPFKQEVEVTRTTFHVAFDEYHLEIGFGGPKVTWVTVMCNRTAEIRFLHQTGVWISTESVLLASFESAIARHNFGGEHTTNIVEIDSDGPFIVVIEYTYILETEVSVFSRTMFLFDH